MGYCKWAYAYYSCSPVEPQSAGPINPPVDQVVVVSSSDGSDADDESSNWDRWNPMKDSYENKQFNSYHKPKDQDQFKNFREKHEPVCG